MAAHWLQLYDLLLLLASLLIASAVGIPVSILQYASKEGLTRLVTIDRARKSDTTAYNNAGYPYHSPDQLSYWAEDQGPLHDLDLEGRSD